MVGSDITLEKGKSLEQVKEGLAISTELPRVANNEKVTKPASHQETNSSKLAESIEKEIEAILSFTDQLFHNEEEASDRDAFMLINKICVIYNNSDNRSPEVQNDKRLKDCLKAGFSMLDPDLRVEVLSDVIQNQAIPKGVRQELFTGTVDQLTFNIEATLNKSVVELFNKICDLYNDNQKVINDSTLRNSFKKTFFALDPDLRMNLLTDTIENQKISKKNAQEFFTDVIKVLSSGNIPLQSAKDVLSLIDRISTNESMVAVLSGGQQNVVKDIIHEINIIHSFILNSPYLDPELTIKIAIEKINLERFLNYREDDDLHVESNLIVSDLGSLINELPKDIRKKLLKILIRKKKKDEEEDPLANLKFALNKLNIKKNKEESEEEESEEEDDDEGKAVTSIKWYRNSVIVINYLNFARRLKIFLSATKHNPQQGTVDILPYGVFIKPFPINRNVSGEITLTAIAEDEMDRVSDTCSFVISPSEIQHKQNNQKDQNPQSNNSVRRCLPGGKKYGY